MALNEFTFVHAFKNIYFRHDPSEAINIIEPNTIDLREQFGHELLFTVKDTSTKGSVRYKVVPQEDTFDQKEGLIVTNERQPQIRTFFKPLKIRTSFKPFDTQSAAGLFSSREVFLRCQKIKNASEPPGAKTMNPWCCGQNLKTSKKTYPPPHTASLISA